MDLANSPDCASVSLAFHHAYINRDKFDLDKLYEGYDACADFTAAAFYKEMLQKYPDAKVILTERPADSWFKSIQNTLFKSAPTVSQDPSDPNYELGQLGLTLVFDGLMKDPENFDRKELFTKMYLDHNAEVKRLVPAEQLYVMVTGEGWEGICKFLGKDMPDVPYPSINNTVSFHQSFGTDRLLSDNGKTGTVKVASGTLQIQRHKHI